MVFNGFVAVFLPECHNLDWFFVEVCKASAGQGYRIAIAARGGVEK